MAAGCSTPEEEAAPIAATIVSFEAAPAAIAPGGAAILTWEVGGAKSLALAEKGGDPIPLGPDELRARQIEVRPERSTRYVLSATGRDGVVVASEAKVIVRISAPEILSFEASAALVSPGEDVTLSWATENASSIRIVAKDGTEVPVPGASPADGAVVVRPNRTTSYTLWAANSISYAEATVTIEVRAGLDVELTSDLPVVEYGQSTILRWRSREASRIVVRAGADVLVDSASELAGSLTVSPVVTTVYEITAHGESGTATASAQVAIAPAIESFAPAAAGPFARGADVELRWSVRGADAIRITSAGFVFDAGTDSLAEGSVVAVVPADGRFELEATLGAEKTARALVLPLLDAAAVLSFSATPALLTVPEGGTADVDLAWTTARADAVEIAVDGEVVHASADGAGTATMAIDRDTAFVLTAKNAAGAATARAEVRAFAPPFIDSFEARPGHAGVGEAFELSWSTRNAAALELLLDGERIHSSEGGDGSFTTQLASGSTFRLRAANGAGETTERTVAVTVGPPSIVAFTADRTLHGPGSTVRFSWQVLGGTSLTVQDPAGRPVSGCTTSDLARIPAGQCAVLLPTTTGSLRYTLVVANSLTQGDSAFVDLQILDGPVIQSFYADRTRATVGEGVTFHWAATSDGDGTAPSIALTDGADSYLAGTVPAVGSATVAPLRAGARTFRLTASTPGSTPSVRDVDLDVYDAPTLTASASSTTWSLGGSPIVLSWQTSHAIEVTVDELDDDGGATRVSTIVSPALVASGQVGVQPPAPGRTYRIAARNAAGSSVAREIEVTWTQPSIDEFSATPTDVRVRGTTTLQWVTTDATTVAISPPPVVEAEPFLDLSARSTATELSLASCGAAQLPTDGCADVVLPFAFPYDGQARTQARIYLHGVLGFDTGYQGASASNAALPSSANSFVALAPFWQTLRTSVSGATRTGAIWYEHGTGPSGRWAAIQWAGFWVAGASATQQVELDFEVVLYESGDFDFRYGRMDGAAGLAAWTDGREASIGHQTQGGAAGRSILYRARVDGGLSDLSLGFRAGAVPAAGSFVLPQLFAGVATYTLTATSSAGARMAQAAVTTHENVSLSGVRVVEAYPLPNSPFTVEWTATGAAEVRIERPQADPQDPIVVLCTVLPGDPQQCTLQEPAAGIHDYVVRALGYGFGDEQVAALQVEVFPVFSIDSFTASASPVTVGDDVTLSWTTTNATSLTLTANGASVNIASLPRAGGSVVVTVTEDTTYVLTAKSRGRTLTATVTVTAEDPPPPPEEE